MTNTRKPSTRKPSTRELAKATSWETIRDKRKQWWSFQPIRNIAPPAIPGNTWSEHPVDRFVLSKLAEKGLVPGAPADAATLVRRCWFALVGLPPTPDEVAKWSARLARPGGMEELADHLLASPHFGEHWARHWMDWVRYAESHGSEGDPDIVNAWYYRDYLIRALNANVSYDQLVREHFAGDLLEQPRINRELGINESMIGPAHWRMVFHGFAPTDPLAEKVRFIDDEVGTFSKAFLGLTVSCARCHDHKFDPISQKDYYALFGILGSCRPGRAPIDIPEKLNANRDKLAALKPQIRAAIAGAWLESAASLRSQLLDENGPWKKAEKPALLLHPLYALHKDPGAASHFVNAWKRRAADWERERKQRETGARRNCFRYWNLAADADYRTWFHQGNGLPDKPQAAGEFSVAADGANALTGIYPAGVYSHSLTAKSSARLSSGYVHLNDNYELWLRVIGDGTASVRYVVQDYPRPGVIFPDTKLSRDWQWQKFDLTYWNEDELHIELSAAMDAPLLASNNARSWFGIREAVIVRKGEPAPSAEPIDFLDPLFATAAASPPRSFDELADCYVGTLKAAIAAWQAGAATDAQAVLLDTCLRQGLLANQVKLLPTAKPLIDEYRRLEEEIVVPTRVPGLEETVGRNQPLYERGDHKHPMAEVPRRFLEAIDATPYDTPQSGRRQLAEDLLRDDNPLTRRVIVNRIWHHLFGRGIVATPDNFGHLGIQPTHPELLDYLATHFKDHRGSMKEMIRFIVTSETWQMTSRPSEKARQVDPDNQFLSHAYVRRLEAESIRDSLLAVSGRLSPELFGAPVDGNSTRRSIYVHVRRNALDPFLRAFDFPEPFSATGRRDVTNVPAQSLMMMNDEQVAVMASAWAGRVLADKTLLSDESRIASMFAAALARPAHPAEISEFKAYLAQTRGGHVEVSKQANGLQRELEERRAAIRKLVEPIRERLLADVKTKPVSTVQRLPRPIGRWEFKADLHDAAGSADGEFHDGARVQGGALVVDHHGFVVTSPLMQTIREKTLEAWVQLDDLAQRGGGVMTIQTPDGSVFDSIVFGEKDPRQWVAGSNFFQRTRSFDAPPEQEAGQRPVHIAIAYCADGQIIAYRDGRPYGKSYKASAPVEFRAGHAVVSFGIRHLPAGGNKMLGGSILRAQLYDRALSADEVFASSQSAPFFVAESQILAEMKPADRQMLAQEKQRIAELESRLESLQPAPSLGGDQTVWTDLARAMFTFKEFIYIK